MCLKVIEFVRFPQWIPSQCSSLINSLPLKGLTVVWLYCSYLTTQCIQHLDTHVSYSSICTQFITYTQSQSQCYNPNITIYHANLVNLVQNTNELYKNDSHNMGNKTQQTISYSHIKIKGIKIICSKTQKNTKSTQFYQPIRIRALIDSSNTTIP